MVAIKSEMGVELSWSLLWKIYRAAGVKYRLPYYQPFANYFDKVDEIDTFRTLFAKRFVSMMKQGKVFCFFDQSSFSTANAFVKTKCWQPISEPFYI